jgi:two-component system, NtrC family, response regulator HydG
MSDEAPSILVVDDDVDICANMADILADLGYRVDVAHEGVTALELVRRRPYDVALLDYKMPGMDGVTLCRAIQGVQSGVVPLLVTAYSGGDTARGALEAGAWRVLSKPVDFPELMSLVAEAIGRPMVLVVDDDADLCTSLRDVLREHGFRVCTAHDEAEAIERLREATRVVLLDLRLPGGDGAEVFRRVRKIKPSARVVLITGHRAELEPRIERLKADGLDGICYKPFDIPELLGILDRLLGV